MFTIIIETIKTFIFTDFKRVYKITRLVYLYSVRQNIFLQKMLDSNVHTSLNIRRTFFEKKYKNQNLNEFYIFVYF